MPMLFQDYVEQIHHQNNPFDKSRLIHELLQLPDVTIEKIARHLLVSPSYVSSLAKLHAVPESIKDGYLGKLITFTHVRLLARLKSTSDMLAVYEECLAKNMSTTQLEERINELAYAISPQDTHLPDITQARILQARMNMRFPDVKTKIIQTRIRTKVSFELKEGRKQGNEFLKTLSDLVGDLK